MSEPYSNYDKIRALGKALNDLAEAPITLLQRDCPDVPIFLDKLRKAQEATRNHTILFDN